MLKYFTYFVISITVFFSGWLLNDLIKKGDTKISVIEELTQTKEKLLNRYTIENLAQTDVQAGKFTIGESLKNTDEFESFLFSYEFNPNLDGKTYKKITGQINLPITPGTPGSEIQKHSVVLMLRGYINQKTYETGDGTRNASEYFAKEGYITIAPDFLGYGASDKETENIFEARFQTYVTAISLLKYLETNPEIKFGNWKLVIDNLFLWGHSNGGQIALTILEITQNTYPTTLWAPVSKPFPYSILYYTDQSEDRGKLIRSELAEFEKNYDVEKYSLINYLAKINAPLQIHQGTSDEAVPKSWSDSLAEALKEKGKDITYYVYPSADHNMHPDWNGVIERDIHFFANHPK